MNRKSGFTLVETVVMIAVLGVLAIVAIQIVPNLSRSRLDVAAKQVTSDIELARQMAQTKGQTSGVKFVSGGSYTAYLGTTATPIKSPLTKADMVILLSSNYPGVSISSNYVVEFNRFGQPTTGGGGSVTLTDGTSTKTVTITANTGKVTQQ